MKILIAAGWLVLLFGLLLPVTTIAQNVQLASPGDEYWSDRFYVNPVGAGVEACVTYGGKLVVAGSFDELDGTPISHIGLWDLQWQSIGGGLDSAVSVLYVFDNELYAAGNFVTAGSASVNRVAKFNGTTWAPLDQEITSGHVTAFGQYNGELIMAGSFAVPGITGTIQIARWDGNAWHALGTGEVDGTIAALEVYDGQLYVGGDFQSVGGVTASNLARWNGSAWSGFSDTFDNQINALKTFDSKLYLGGLFTTFGATNLDHIASWDGATLAGLGGLNGECTALTIFDSKLIIYGSFTQAAGQPARGLASWNGVSLAEYASGVHGTLFSAMSSDGVILYVVGNIAGSFDGSAFASVGRWDGVSWHAVTAGNGLGVLGTVSRLVPYFGNTVVAVGKFTYAGASLAGGVARLTSTGWVPLGSGVPNILASDNDMRVGLIYGGSLIVGGRFDSIGGIAARNIARWDGSAWHAIGSGPDSAVQSMAVNSGSLYIGGRFHTVDGKAAEHVARWNSVTWSSVESSSEVDGSTLISFYGELYAGGTFAGSRVGKWSGSAWTPVGSLDSLPLAFAIHQDQLYALQSSISRWNGSAWETLASVDGPAQICCGHSYGDKLLVGGDFWVNGVSQSNHLVAFDGTSFTSLGTSPDLPVRTLEAYDTAVYVGGMFTSVGGKNGQGVSAWQPDADNDAFLDAFDNCPEVANPDQLDTDENGIGDACESCCVGVRGNADNDPGQNVDISDLQIYIDFLFFGGGLGPCWEEMDVFAGDGVDITDLQTIIDFLFFGGALPGCL